MDNYFLYNFKTIITNYYFTIGISIWALKVLIYFLFALTRCPRYNEHEPRTFYIICVFFSPNILIWPITIMLDIYSLCDMFLKNYSASEILFAAVGF